MKENTRDILDMINSFLFGGMAFVFIIVFPKNPVLWVSSLILGFVVRLLIWKGFVTK